MYVCVLEAGEHSLARQRRHSVLDHQGLRVMERFCVGGWRVWSRATETLLCLPLFLWYEQRPSAFEWPPPIDVGFGTRMLRQTLIIV